MKDKPLIVIELDAIELAVLLTEEIIDVNRPEGMTALQAFREIEEKTPELADRVIDAAYAAMEYFKRQAELANKIQ